MNMAEYAIARTLNQLLRESDKRPLTEKETRLTEFLAQTVEVYEAREGKPSDGEGLAGSNGQIVGPGKRHTRVERSKA